MRIPISQIETHHIPRDRTAVTKEATEELQNSILKNGLRMPIEVYETDTGYALISGFRRLSAFEHLTEQGLKGFEMIEATLRHPNSPQEAAAMMVEENEIRLNLSAWEKSNIVITATERGLFDTYDAAINALFPQAARQKRAKIRSIVTVIEHLDSLLIDPELWSEAKLLRLANAIAHDWTDLITDALTEERLKEPRSQWAKINGTLNELEELSASGKSTNPDRPKRRLRVHKGVKVRREITKYGYCLHVSVGGAADGLITSVLEQVEYWLTDG